MARQARKKSNTGIYHIMMRGIDRQLIFEDEDDKERFWQTLKDYKEKSGYEVYGYCFMDNHVHLLIKFNEEDMCQVMKRITVSYAYYFNVKYRRTGHLFQNRYRSVPVEDDAYLVTVLRYIHRNPVVEGLCKKPKDFIWSSYRDYIRAGKRYDILTDTGLVIGMIGIEEFKRYSADPVDDEKRMLEPEEPRALMTDAQAKKLLEIYSGCSNGYEFHSVSKEKRNDVIKRLYDSGAGFNQICRVTGWSQPVVQRVLGS